MCFLLIAIVCGSVNSAQADVTLTQEPEAPPAGTVGGQTPATSGATELEGQGTFATAAEKPKVEETTDATELTLSAGGMLSTGNSRAASMTGMADFRLRRYIHQAQAVVVGNYGLTSEEGKDNFKKETVENIQGRIRYDIFFHPRWSAFTMATARHDVFQGLDLRLNIDPGVAFFALTKPNHRLWFEAGYDFQFDLRTKCQRDPDNPGETLKDMVTNDCIKTPNNRKTSEIHAARLFGGYVNKLSENLTFNTGLEYLQSLQHADVFRLNWENALSVQFKANLSIAATFILRYENTPLDGVEKLDTQTALNLVYRLP